MAKTPNNGFIDDLLDLFTSRVHRRRQQSRVCRPSGRRVIGEGIDDTGIGSQNETDNLIINDIYVLDCGHASDNNLGGECHYCDRLVCKDCISICASCGHSLCPQHTVIANFDDQAKPYCRSCEDEMSRKLKLRVVTRKVLSFFVSDKED